MSNSLRFGALVIMLILIAGCAGSDDVTPPVITLLGSSSETQELGVPYVDPGYTATDDVDGDISDQVIVSGAVNHLVEGDYYLRYNVTDEAGNAAEEVTRKVKVLIF